MSRHKKDRPLIWVTSERLLLEARIEHFDQNHQQPITGHRLLHLIAQHLMPFRGSPLFLFIGGFVESSCCFFNLLHGSGFDAWVLEVFCDVHAHYGLTAMSGNAVAVACGSHWYSMYYDQLNHVHCFASARATWDDVTHSLEPWASRFTKREDGA